MINKGIMYDNKTKKCIIDMYKNGQRISLISKKYNITRATIYNWIKEYSIKEDSSEYELMKNQIENLKIENEILKKSNYLSFMEDKNKTIEFINKYKNEYDITFMCQVFKMPRSTYYKIKVSSEIKEDIETSINDGKIINTETIIKKYAERRLENAIDDLKESEKHKEKDIRNINTYNDAPIFKNIDLSKFIFLKTQLASKLGINYEIEKDSQNVIDKIYEKCIEGTNLFSWKSIKNTVLENYNILEDNDDLGYIYKDGVLQKEEAVKRNIYNPLIKENSVYDQTIKDHCIIISLYTVEYLLQRSKYVSLSKLGNRIKGMGYNFLLRNNYFNTSYEFDSSGFIIFRNVSQYKPAFPRKIDEKNYDTNNENRGSAITGKINYNMNYIKKVKAVIKSTSSLDSFKVMRNNNNHKNKKNKELLKLKSYNKIKGIFKSPILNIIEYNQDDRSVPLFLSNFSYNVLENINTVVSIEKEINEANRSNLLESLPEGKKKKTVENYNKLSNNIFYYENFNDLEDKILFEFEKERQLNKQYINYCESMGILSNDIDVDLEIVKLIMLFPNVFSRKIYIDYILYLYNVYGLACASDMIDVLLKKIFPIVEKTFFISLFEHCNNDNQDIKYVLQSMDELLKKYINTNFDRIMTFYKSIEDQEVNISYKNVDINKVYGLVRFNFKYLFNLRNDFYKDYREILYLEN